MKIILLLIALLSLRTLAFHLQQWQIREYRWDRLRDHLLRTEEGRKKLWNLWFFKGFFPRPQISGRLLMILFFTIILHIGLFFLLNTFFVQNKILLFLISERLIALTVGFAVFLSWIPSHIIKKSLFQKARDVIRFYDDQNITRIGITGSYGKSSTKEILVHLLISQYGPENVLYNPRNENNETAIARLLLRSRGFFTRVSPHPKFIVIEMGAYKKGEIQTMCEFVQPHYGILTGVGNQHISLFGSQRNIQEGKFELAQSATKAVYFNADSPLLAQMFDEKTISATKIPLSQKACENIVPHIDRTDFFLYGRDFTLPWMGSFFVSNALLCLELCRDLGMEPSEMNRTLKNLPPLSRALSIKRLSSGATLINDPYSANLEGVLKAIEEMKKFKGQKIFVGIPLIELGNDARTAHEKIFTLLQSINAEVWWLKKDYAILGEKILEKNFHGKNLSLLAEKIKSLGEGDVLLLESRLPTNVENLLSHQIGHRRSK